MFNKKREHSSFSSKNCLEDIKYTKMKSTTTKDIFLKTHENTSVGNESSSPSDTPEHEVQRIPSIFLNGSFEKVRNISQINLPSKKSPKSTGSIKSSSNSKDPNSVANILEIKKSLSCLEGGMKVLKKDVRRCSSLTDSLKVQKQEFCFTSPLTENELSFPRQTLHFKHPSSGYKARHFDYVKEFDSVINDNLYNELQNACRCSDNPRSVFSLTPNISPASEPIRLKRRTYAYGMLSINNFADTSCEKVNEGKQSVADEQKTMSEQDESIYYSSGEDSGDNGRKDSAPAETDKPTYLSKSNKESNNNSSSLLIIKEPLKIKCIDEATKSAKEILIYSDEFLWNLQKGNKEGKASEMEIFDSLLQHCIDYDGKSLRIILDTKNFLNSLSISSKQRGNCTKSNSSKKVNHGSDDSARNRVPTKKIPNAASKSRSFLNEQPNQLGKSYIKQTNRKKDIVDKDDKVKKFSSKHSFSSRESILNTQRKETTTSLTINENGERNENGRKSRIALKRVNADEIIASKFRNYFHFYAKFRSRLKSGIAISKNNSNFWLKTCGIIYDIQTEKLADDHFEAVAKTKCILNISDYIQYLITFAKRQRMILVDIIDKLMSYDIRSLSKAECVKDKDTSSSPLQSNQSTKDRATAEKEIRGH